MAVYENRAQPELEAPAVKRPLRMFGISSRGLVTPRDFETLANVFLDAPPGLVPSKMGLYEPMRQKFAPAEIRLLAEKRGEEPFEISWKSAKCDVEATKYIPGYMHGTLQVAADPDIANDDEVGRFIGRVAEVFQPTLLMTHLLNPMDAPVDSQSRMRVEGADRPTFSTHWTDLKEGLPNFYWGMVFGAPYVGLFGMEKLLSTPAHRVTRISAQEVFVQLTPSILDCDLRHDAVVEARKKAILHLGEAAFMASSIDAMGLSAERKKASIFGKRESPARAVPAIAP